MIHKYEKADGTIIVSGSIDNYKDFKNCIIGCAENKDAQKILCEFGKSDMQKLEEYLPKLEKDYTLQEQKKRAAWNE